MMFKSSAIFCSTILAASLCDVAVAQTAAPADISTQDEEGGEDIVVTGLRRSLESAQNIKRSSEQIVDAIVAEDIGKLPDITASASLARVAGVQVTRAAGEAADVTVRGLPDLSTTYNGREIFTAENRRVALQDFPAGGVAALEVYKSSTANLVEGGIAGQINVRSRRPFDFPGLRIFGSVAGVHLEQSQRTGMNANILLSNRWNTGIGEIGVLVNASYAETKFLDSTREQSFFVPAATPAQSSTSGFRYPDATALFFGQGDRWRPSVNASLQWRPDPALTVTIDGLFQGFRGRDNERFLFVPLFGGVRFSDVVLRDGTNLAESLTASYANPLANRPDGYSAYNNGDTDTYQFGGNIIWERDGLKISGDVAYTDSVFINQQVNIDYLYATSPTRDVNFDIDGDDGGPSFSLRDFDVIDPRNYIFRGLFERSLEARGDDVQARLDLSYEIGGLLQRIDVGARYSDRNASRRSGGRYSGQAQRGIRYGDPLLPLEYENAPPGFTFNDAQRIKSWIVPTRDSVLSNLAELRTLVGFAAGPAPFVEQEAFDADETSYAAYGQIKYGFETGLPIDGLIGLRAVRTEGEVTGTSRVVAPAVPGGPNVVSFVPVSRGRDYWDYLPNASIRMRFLPELQLRAAYTETRTRPRFDQLNPSANINPPPECATDGDTSNDANCFRTGGGGNPNLRPLVSTNYDLSLEYFFERAGSVSVAAFRRDVNGFIANATVDFNDPEFGLLRFSAPDNGGDGRIEGVEVSFSSFLRFGWVPEWARNFGLQANYTYVDAKAELAPSLVNSAALGNLLPGPQRLPGVSKHTYNIVALYEIPQFSARLAYNHRSDYVEFYLRNNDPVAARDRVLPVKQTGRGVLDFSTSVTPVENATLFFDVSNLLGTPISTYREFDGAGGVFPRARKYVERVFSLGLRLRY